MMANHYDVVIVGAGLAGLTTAYSLKKIRPALSILIIERSGTAGGLTGDWVDHRFGENKKLQMPMHMIFNKYENLIPLIGELGAETSPLFTGFPIITGDGMRHPLEMNDWTSRRLPPPLHALGMFLKLKFPLSAKWDLAKLASVGTWCAKEISEGRGEPLPNTLSFESLELLLHMGKKARNFVETVTPSIYNLHPWYTSAPRMAMVLAGTMTMSRNALHHRVFGKNYNAAIIDRYVAKLKSMGVDFRFWTEARRIESSDDGSRVTGIWIKGNGPEIGKRYVCENCGAENYCLDRAFCTRCGRDTTQEKMAQGIIQRTAPETGEMIRCGHLVTAIYPHMIARLIPTGSPLRRHPFVRSFYSSRGNQTQLSIGRVYYTKQVTRGDQRITGTHNPTFCFNGCQSVLNNFGAKDLGWEAGDVVDVLLDVGIIRDAFSHEEQKEKIVNDLQRVYPDADPSLVSHVSFADIYPEVLYLSEQPAIAGMHRFFDTHRTGAKNWFVAGCHSGKIGIGMESAVESGMTTANCLLEEMGVSERVPIRPYPIHLGSRILATIGRGLLLWKSRGRSMERFR